MPVKETPVVELDKKLVVEQGGDKVKQLKTKEMVLQKTSEVSLMRKLVSGFDPANITGNYQSKDFARISIYLGKVSKTWRFKCHETNKEGDVFALWGHCYGLDYPSQLNDILEHINQRMSLGL